MAPDPEETETVQNGCAICLRGACVLEREKERNLRPAFEGQEGKGESPPLSVPEGLACVLETATQNWDRRGRGEGCS